MSHYVYRFPNGLGVSVLTQEDTPCRLDDAEACVLRLTGPDTYSVTHESARLDAHEVGPFLSEIASR